MGIAAADSASAETPIVPVPAVTIGVKKVQQVAINQTDAADANILGAMSSANSSWRSGVRQYSPKQVSTTTFRATSSLLVGAAV